jgi:hypothetical protein
LGLSLIVLDKIRDLNLFRAPSYGRPLHLSAASGLVRAGSLLYVIADDELQLGVFSAADTSPGTLVRLFPGELLASKEERKAAKPDLEALVRLPAFSGYASGALLALGSGSRRNRRRGALLPLAPDGTISGAASLVDLSPLLAPLESEFPSLNIEGALICGGELCLLQRGNKRTRDNAIVRFALAEALAALAAHGQVKPLAPLGLKRVDLGEIAGIPLCFTDGAALPDGNIVFSAIAENTADNYSDGPCAGAAIGIMDAKGNLRSVEPLERPYKVEGIDAHAEGGAIQLLLVTDDDDAFVPACLYSATIPYPEHSLT